jgi:hypothetical protein
MPTGYDKSAVSACRAGAVVTPSDTEDLPVAARSLWVGTGGDLVVIPLNGDTALTFKGVPAGFQFTWSVRRVLATGTTAADIIADLG